MIMWHVVDENGTVVRDDWMVSCIQSLMAGVVKVVEEVNQLIRNIELF